MKSKKLVCMLSLLVAAGMIAACKPADGGESSQEKESSIVSEVSSGEESKPSSAESKPSSAESKPSSAESKPSSAESKPSSAESKPSSAEDSKPSSASSEDQPVEKSLAYAASSLAKVEDKAILTISYNSEGYSAAEIEALTPFVDFQKNPRAASGGTSWDGTWDYYAAGNISIAKTDNPVHELEGDGINAVLDEGVAKFNIDITALPEYQYTTHFDPLGEAVKDLKPGAAYAMELTPKVVVGNKAYQIIIDPTDGDGVRFWGCLGVIVTPVGAPSATIKGQNLVVEDDKLFLVLTGEYENYEAAELAAAELNADLQSVQDHPNYTTGGWNKNVIAAEKMSIRAVDDSNFEMKIDISDFGANAWCLHVGIGGPAVDSKTNVETDVKVTFNGFVYNLVVVPGSSAASGFWGCQGLIVKEAGAKTFQFNGGRAEKADDKAYFVVTGACENYTEDELEALEPFFDIEANGDSAATKALDAADRPSGKVDLSEKAEVKFLGNDAFEIWIDITDVALGGYYTHTKLAGKGNADSGDVKPGVAIDSHAVVGGKDFKVLCVPGGNNGLTFWSNLALEVYEAPAEPEAVPFGGEADITPDKMYYWNDQDWVGSNVTVSKAEVLDGVYTFKYTATGANKFGFQLFYKDSSLVQGQKYNVSFKLNVSSAVDNTDKTEADYLFKVGANNYPTLIAGDNEISYEITQGARSSLSLQFAAALGAESEFTIVLSDLKFAEPGAEIPEEKPFALKISENGEYKYEAEDGDYSKTTFRNLHDSAAVIENEAASGGKYLNCFDAINNESWGPYVLHLDVEKDCDINLSMFVSMPEGVAVGSLYKRFYVKLDGSEDFGNCTSLTAREELDWEESTFPNKIHVAAGEHTIVFNYREKTGTGSPYIDYFKIVVSGIAQ